MAEAPFVRLGDGQDAPILRYSVPESTSYVGRHVIAINIAPEFLNEQTRERLTAQTATRRRGPEPSIGSLVGQRKFTVRSESSAVVRTAADRVSIAAEHTAGLIFQPKESTLGFTGSFEVIRPRPAPVKPKILLFERIQLSNFLGDYGAGRVLKTFSLFPGERTKISVRTYQRTSESRNAGSSILDSVTTEAAEEFEASIATESSAKYSQSELDILYSQKEQSEGSGSASALWGLAEADVSVALASETTGEWGTKSARESNLKVVGEALQKHSARASAKRNVEVNTSTAATSESGEESGIERVIENVNVSRTLNLVFRQMVQEYVSVTHLTDVKIALYDGSNGPYPQYSLHELDRFLDDYFSTRSEHRSTIRNGIIRELAYVFDYLDRPVQFLEKARLEIPQEPVQGLEGVPLAETVEYFRVNKSLRQSVEGSDHIEVPGVILDVRRITMRTDGTVCDGFLGQGQLLDPYSEGLQVESVRERQLANDRASKDLERMSLGLSAVADNDGARAELLGKMFGGSELQPHLRVRIDSDE